MDILLHKVVGRIAAASFLLCLPMAALHAEGTTEQNNGENRAFFASPVKQGMTKEEVAQAIGKPYYIAGAKDPGNFLKKQQELRKHGTVMELWMYRVPYNFIVYFINGKVSSVEYVGETSWQNTSQP